MSIELTITVRNLKELEAERENGSKCPVSKVGYDDLRKKTIAIFQDWLSQVKINKSEEFEVLGTHLYQTLFSDSQVNGFFKSSLKEVPKGQRLRIQLSFEKDAAALANWPWEYLYYPGTENEEGFFMSTKTDLVLSRYMHLITGRERLDPEEKPLRVLIAVSDPEDPEKKLGPVISAPVIEGIEKLRERYDIKIDILEKPTSSNFVDILKKTKPHVLHYIGHGRFNKANKKGEIALLKSDEKSVQWCPDKTFAGYLSQVFIPRLVFLHLCEGATTDLNVFYTNFAGLAPQLIRAKVQAVVAMQYPITNRDAIVFSKAFYGELAKGNPIDDAVQMGRWNIALEDPEAYSSRAFGTPVLYMHSRDGIIQSSVDEPPGGGFSTGEPDQEDVEQQEKEEPTLKIATRETSPGDIMAAGSRKAVELNLSSEQHAKLGPIYGSLTDKQLDEIRKILTGYLSDAEIQPVIIAMIQEAEK